MLKWFFLICPVMAAFWVFTGFRASPELQVNQTPISNDSSSHCMYVFTGSDWCNNCRRFEKNVLRHPEFIKALHASKIKIHLVDFPQRKKLSREQVSKNDSLALALEFEGVFPGIILRRNSDGKKISIPYSHEEGPEFAKIIGASMENLP